MNMPVRLTINGQDVELEIPARELLLDLLRERLGLTGAKRACDLQVCGACTVLVNGQPVSACNYLAVDAHEARVETIEGLAVDGALHPLQKAFIDLGAVQCGYCTPGMLMMAKAMMKDLAAQASDDEIRMYMLGNLCRCTGYTKILQALRTVIQHPA